MIGFLALSILVDQTKLPSIEFEGTKVGLIRVEGRIEQEISVGGKLVLVSGGHPLFKPVAEEGLTPIRFNKARQVAEKSGLSLILESSGEPKQSLKITIQSQGKISCSYSSTYADIRTLIRGELVQYCLVPDRKLGVKPSGGFSPRRLRGPGSIIGDHALNTPIIMASAGGYSATLVLDQHSRKPGEFPAGMTFDCTMAVRPAATLGAGCLAYTANAGQMLSPTRLRRAAGPRLEFKYELFVQKGEPDLIELTDSMFQEQRLAFEWFAAPQVMPFHEYVRLGYNRGPNQILADGTRAWTEREVDTPEGDKEIGAVARLDEKGKRVVDFDIRNNPIRAAFGFFYWATTLQGVDEDESNELKSEVEKQKRPRSEWLEYGERTVDLLLTAPQKEGTLPQRCTINGLGRSQSKYTGFLDSTYTYLWLLRSARLVPDLIKDAEVRECVKPLFEQVLAGDSKTIQPDTAACSLMFLLECSTLFDRISIQENAQKLVFIIETLPLEVNGRNGWTNQGELETVDVALRLEALAMAHRHGGLKVDSDAVRRLIKALSLLQYQMVSPSRQSALLWGGFPTSNSSLEFDAVVTGIAANALMAAGAEWKNEIAFRRGVAALRSSLALANNVVTIANGVFITDTNPDSLIFTSWGRNGTDGDVERSGFYGGEGAVLANLAYAQAQFGDSYQLDADGRSTIGINGLADGSALLSTVATMPTSWLTKRRAIVAGQGQTRKLVDVGVPNLIREMHLAIEDGKVVIVATPNFILKSLPENPRLPTLRWTASAKPLAVGLNGFIAEVTTTEMKSMPFVQGTVGDIELTSDQYPLLPTRFYANPIWTFASNDLTDWHWNVNAYGVWNPTSAKSGEITTGWSYDKKADETRTGVILSPEFLINCEQIELVTSGAFDPECLVELIRSDGSAIFSDTGQGRGESITRVWTVGPYRGERVRIRLFDRSRSGHLALRKLSCR